MRYRQMKEVLAALERAEGRFLVYGALAEQPRRTGGSLCATLSGARTSDRRLRPLSAWLPRSRPSGALAVVNPSFPEAHPAWADVLRLIPRLEGYYTVGKLPRETIR